MQVPHQFNFISLFERPFSRGYLRDKGPCGFLVQIKNVNRLNPTRRTSLTCQRERIGARRHCCAAGLLRHRAASPGASVHDADKLHIHSLSLSVRVQATRQRRSHRKFADLANGRNKESTINEVLCEVALVGAIIPRLSPVHNSAGLELCERATCRGARRCPSHRGYALLRYRGRTAHPRAGGGSVSINHSPLALSPTSKRPAKVGAYVSR